MLRRLIPLLLIGILIEIPNFFPAKSSAQDLLEGTDFSKQYLIQLSGTVMNETFSGAQGLLTLMAPIPGSNNPYQIIIEAFPKKNSRNSFFWNGENSDMMAISNEITCDIKRTFVKPVPMHFFFLSPSLLRYQGTLEQADDEGKKAAEKVALPTLITARAGRLKIRIHTDSVSGTVWMKGYDPTEKAYVLYSAKLYGKRSFRLEPKQQIQKGTMVGE
jgi:hypothetical protein